ncbi:LysM repeat-containing protein [Pedobacter steynii]|uniref:LysM repeat-containing protein n=1 Tax=Pedobacter steynii TaxID=430522 RepID=A0A1G9P321_9SPHI|nr:LysM peptidoglycan-binding domain-containing protein [Pedobacter steynii]NQX39110.1 LysM peptidoglycan-binding domain-containing protein [Pedobacter steynii]SDL92953.1 LysM repeat-containing protein [Pedobacter steynii]
MYKYYIVSLFAVVLNLSAASANTNTRDSIGVENRNGKKLIIHQVIAKDTYYSIGRRYSVTPKDIMTFNDNKFLQIGVVIKVPTNVPFVSEQAPGRTTASGKTSPTVQSNTSNSSVNEAAEGGLIEHTVQKKENLNMLAEKYGTTVNEIKRVNNMRSINLQIGQLLKIPAKNAVEEQPAETLSTTKPNTPAVVAQQNPPIETKKKEDVLVPIFPKKQPVNPAQNTANQTSPAQTTPTNTEASSEELLVHTVASNETIYSIATTYKMTMDQLKAKNGLINNSLTVGQKLLIRGQYPPKPLPSAHNEVENPADTLNSIKNPSLRLPASRYGLNQMDEKGTGIWIADPDLDPSKMLVLHRTAPIGTVMKITNPMSNRSTFAKVVGKFTENESTKDVIIVMTKAVADALGALDKRFFCNLTYGGQDNEQ